MNYFVRLGEDTRIISGKYKGRKLLSPNSDSKTRPTLDRTKETLFNILQFSIENSVVLDLFSGSGALGLECVSRGAREVVFVDNNKSSVELIKKNCQLVGHNGNVILFDYANFLNSYEGQKFDIVFIDPPYNSDFYKIALEIISSRNLLNADGIISCEHSATVQLPDKVGMMEKSSIRKVGLVEFSFYTLCKEEKK